MTAAATIAPAPITVPACGCGRGPVARFTADAEGAPVLACLPCFRELAPAGRITHHTRSSHADCQHDTTPKSRAACRAARADGRVYVEDGFEGDTVEVIRTKGGKVHAAAEDGTAVCTGKLIKSGTVEDAPVSDVDCTRCLASGDMND